MGRSRCGGEVQEDVERGAKAQEDRSSNKKVARRSSRKAGAAGGSGPAIVTTVATPWERNAVVVELTERIRAVDRETKAALVHGVVELGRLLFEVQQLIPYGEWTRWLSEGVHIEPRTATRYMQVSQWAASAPQEFAKVEDLDITKIYRLLSLEPQVRRRLYDRPIRIPASGVRLRLPEMTVPQLDDVIRDLTARPPEQDPVPKLVQGARHRVAALQAHAEQLIEHGDHIDPETIAELHEDLLQVAQSLQDAFDL